MSLICAGFSFMSILYIALAICVLLLMVMIHELGHYIAGRILGFKINEFSIGFGKAIFSKINKRGEKISLRIFPLGGYCAFAGEDDEEEDKDKNAKDNNEKEIELKQEDKKVEETKSEGKLFNEQKCWKRMIVYFAGVFFNFISAIIFSFILLVSFGYDIQQIDSIKNGYNQPLQNGDAIYAVENVDVDFVKGNTFSKLVENYLKANDIGETISLKVKHKDGTFENLDCPIYQLKYSSDVVLTTKNAQNEDIAIYCDEFGNQILTANEGDLLFVKDVENNTILRVKLLGVSTKSYPLPFFEALGKCFYFTVGLAWIVIKTLFMLVTFQIPLNQIGGPIATITIIASSAQANIVSLFVLLPLIAANLAVFNLLPFPALDGSHMLFTLIEWIRGKPINRKVEGIIHFIGLLTLFAFIIIVDIIYLVSGI